MNSNKISHQAKCDELIFVLDCFVVALPRAIGVFVSCEV